MRPHIIPVLLVLAPCLFAKSQVAPAATTGTAGLRYAFRYSEMFQTGDTLGTWHTIDASGSLNYTNGRPKRPFSLEYAGGYTSTLSGPSYSTGSFHHLLVSQGVDWRKWILNVADDVGYRPQSPITGFSGVPGIGEPIGNGSSPPSSQLILTLNAHALENNASLGVQRVISRGSILNVGAQHDLLHYVDGNGIDTDGVTISAEPRIRLDARNFLITQYAFARFTYPDYDVNFQTDKMMFGLDKLWSRTFRFRESVGPEWVTSSTAIPDSTGVAASGSLDYQLRRISANLRYDRGTSGGSGYMVGGKADSVSAGFSRPFSRTLTVDVAGGYRRTADSVQRYNIANEFGSLQASWRIGRYLNAFANYSAASQSSGTRFSSNVLNQLLQVVSFGVGYSRETRRH